MYLVKDECSYCICRFIVASTASYLPVDLGYVYFRSVICETMIPQRRRNVLIDKAHKTSVFDTGVRQLFITENRRRSLSVRCSRINMKPYHVIHHQVIDVCCVASHQGLSARGNPTEFRVVCIIFCQTFSVVASFLV